ncbi:MAG: TIM barrel protein [Terrisporobacter sp.]|uniref:sugar phosphate isomerase/epimerase family protein n=1 Tax=Terrisporobacter sp. TaxID=1965305 RepID=UPI002FC9B4B9
MKFYVSQLVETKKILPILKKYDVGLEVVQFANPYILDNRHRIVEEYKKELADVYGDVDLIIHGPYADLCPGARDNLIKDVTSVRFEQAYEVAEKLGAKKILYHNGYTPRTYTYIEWKKNVYDFWSEFIKNKEEVPIVVENVLDEDYELIHDLMKKIDKDNFSICIDIGHINAYSTLDIYEWIENLSYKIGHIHLHNNYGDRDSHFGIDKGNMNVMQILKVLNEKCDDISVSLEITDLEELEKSLDVLVEAGFVNLK